MLGIMDCASDRRTEDAECKLTFSPPVYRQRYQKILEIIREVKPRKIVDFGCAECNFIRLLKNENLEDVIGVDIDRHALDRNIEKIRPLFTDFLRPRVSPLTVRLFHGSLSEYDERLKRCDMATLIEVIEHLTPEVLKEMPDNIFGRLKPTTVVLTTPNADFNVLFNLNGRLRHWDHKFEWTRCEFKSWCESVSFEYNDSVSFSGVGQGPVGSDKLGYCSQMAVFVSKGKSGSREICNHSSTITSGDAKQNFPYLLVEECKHPQENENDRMCKINLLLDECIHNTIEKYRKIKDSDISLWPCRNFGYKKDVSQASIKSNLTDPECACGNLTVAGQFDDVVDDHSSMQDRQNCAYSHPEDFWRPAKQQVFIRYLYETYFKGKDDACVDGQFDDAFEEGYENWHGVGDTESSLEYSLADADPEAPFTDSIRVPISLLLTVKQIKQLNATKAEIIVALKNRCDTCLSHGETCVYINVNYDDDSLDDFKDFDLEDSADSESSFEQIHTIDDFFKENWDG